MYELRVAERLLEKAQEFNLKSQSTDAVFLPLVHVAVSEALTEVASALVEEHKEKKKDE